MATKTFFIVYDGRAAGGVGTGDAQVECCAETLEEARRDVKEMFPDGAIYEYDDVEGELTNERFVE